MAGPSILAAPRESSFELLDDSTSPTSEAAAEQNLARVIAEVLHKHYPPPKGVGFWWAVQVNVRGGVAYIYNLALSGTHGYILHLTSIAAANRYHRVMQAGGELLERAGLARDRSLSSDKIDMIQRDIRNNIKYLG